MSAKDLLLVTTSDVVSLRDDIRRGSRRLEVARWLRLLPLLLVVFLALIAPVLENFDPVRVVGPPSQAPGSGFLLGTDPSGMDVYSRLLDATRRNLAIGGLSVLLTSVLALTLGLLTGMNESRNGLRGQLARGAARALDLIDSVPAVILAMVIVALYGANTTTMVISIAIILTPGQARLVRTEVLRIRSEAYLDAARMAGASETSVILREVLPNASWPTIENSGFIFGVAVILTASLGFLGVGLPPPTPEWGAMISNGAPDAAVGRWWSSFFPAVALTLTVASVQLASTAIRTRRDY